MLTLGKLQEVLNATLHNGRYSADMPVVIQVEDGQAEPVNSIGVTEAGMRDWTNLIVPGVANVKSQYVLMLSTLEA